MFPVLCTLHALAAFPSSGHAQTPTIDTIVVERHDVFTAEQAAGSKFYRAMNFLHVITKDYVIRREFLLDTGDTLNLNLLQETERNLRDLKIFKSVQLDTTRLGENSLALRARTQDAWTTSPRLGFQVASEGTVTLNLGATELNFLGRGHLLHVGFRKDVDRNAFEIAGKFDRVFNTDIRASGQFERLSDGNVGRWILGDPFRSVSDDRAVFLEGDNASQRVLQYRSTATSLDTTVYNRKVWLNVATAAFTVNSSPTHYTRVGADLQVRQERFVLDTVTATVADSVSAAFGAFVEYRQARFLEFRRFNGLSSEDIDASLLARVGLVATPKQMGYERSGVGPDVVLLGTVPLPRGFLTGYVEGHAIFDNTGLDSALVETRVTLGFKPWDRHATVLHLQGGIMENPSPGTEYDIGFNVPPRSWPAHSFVGTRSLWGILEHKWFVFDALFGLLGMAVASFVDVGGAWYEGQDARFGGNVGVGIRSGSALGSEARTGRLDIGYRFGNGADQGDRWVLTLGMGWVFGGGKDPSCVPQPYHVRYRCRPRGN